MPFPVLSWVDHQYEVHFNQDKHIPDLELSLAICVKSICLTLDCLGVSFDFAVLFITIFGI